jgi:N-acyl-D-aspartate/D-glutamate deacylase
MIRCCTICLIKNEAVVDGTGVPLRHGDVGIAAGRTVEIGKIGDGAKRVIGAQRRPRCVRFTFDCGSINASK